MTTFDVPLEAELDELRSTRVNALPATVAERAATLRYRLDRVDENRCDGYATGSSPGLAAGTPVEVKAVRVEHHDGTGRVGIHPDTHQALEAAGGVYVIVLYAEVFVDGELRILVIAMEIVEPETVGKFIRSDARGYQKVRWPLLIDEDGVDRERWSA